MKAAGIIAFFRVVDRSNKEMMSAIEVAFGTSAEALWQAVCQLHDHEILDMYDQEVVRISDQVLATYLFYLAFFKERVLSFTALLEHFFPRLRDRLVDALNPVISVFNSKALLEAMRPHVNQVWKTLEGSNNEEGLLHLMEVFWFLKETDILLYVKARISEMNPESVDLSKVEIKTDFDISSPSILNILRPFKYSDESTFRIALELLFDYLAKRPNDLPKVLHLLTKDFGFTHTSYILGFVVQRGLIDMLWERTRKGEDELFSKLFFAVAEQYLHTDFETTKPKGSYAIVLINFQLYPTPELFELRKTIWRRLFHLYQRPPQRDAVLGVLQSYGMSGYKISVNGIVAQDAAEVVPFIKSELDPSSYHHCLVVQDLLDLFYECNVPFDRELRGQFKNEAYAISELLLDDLVENRNPNLDYEERQQLKKKRIKEYFAGYRFEDFKQFFERCLEIREGLEQNNTVYQLQEGVTDVFSALAERSPDLYVAVLEHYLGLGDPLKLRPYSPIAKLIEVCGADRAYEILNRPDYPSKRGWLFGFQHSLPPDEATAERLDLLYALYQEAEASEIPSEMDFLLKYWPLDKQVVIRVTDIILAKTEKDPNHAYALFRLFNPHTETNKNLLVLFADKFDLLKRAYLAVQKTGRHEDHYGQVFARILDHDPNFLLEYIDRMYERTKQPSRHDDTRDYSFLWRRDDYQNLMMQVAERIYERERERTPFWYTYLKAFFTLKDNGKDSHAVNEKQDQFLRALIAQRYDDPNFIQFVFSVIVGFLPERRRSFVTWFLENNKNFKDFAKLPLQQGSLSWSGSVVPELQGRVEYLESLLPLLNTADFLQHKQYVERCIQDLREEIECEKKRDFMKD